MKSKKLVGKYISTLLDDPVKGTAGDDKVIVVLLLSQLVCTTRVVRNRVRVHTLPVRCHWLLRYQRV